MLTVAYYRNSIDEDKQKTSLDTQQNLAYETAKNSRLVIDREYADPKTSARKTEISQRVQFFALLDEIKRGNVKNLLVMRRDRLARNYGQHMAIYRIFKNHNLNVIFTSAELPMNYSASGELVESMLGAANQNEAIKIVSGLSQGRMTVANQDKNPGGRYPYGCVKKDVDNKDVKNKEETDSYKVVKEEMEQVQLMYKLYASDECKSVSDVVRKMFELGMSNRKSKPWEDQAIRNILSNPAYKGKRHFNFKFINGDVWSNNPELNCVGEELWNLVNKKLESSSRPRKKLDEIEINFLLKDFVFCALCKERIKTTKALVNNEICGIYRCKHLKVEKNQFESLLINHLNHHLNHIFEDHWKKLLTYSMQSKIASIEKWIKNLEDQMRRSNDHVSEFTVRWINGVLSELELEELLENLEGVKELQVFIESRRKELNKNLELLEKYKDEKREDWFVKLSLDMDSKQLIPLLKETVSQIVFLENGIRFEFKHPYIKEYTEILNESNNS
ncbi:hypothetical protein GC098_18840 [Paenibacillus sp. LMG 31458]|uniref:Recombinase domain-containing protein n=1 Tax=Paenibacillus phytorum TaxID=2654977 RepID=A0ABX1XY08_9BACL|nr:recombinase family protein [Paenibacillus phytorum]NOU73452.1 hypothetical protein [Paenibacillus phytorum]